MKSYHFVLFLVTMSHLLKDFGPGPLDTYRKKSSFDWKNLKVFLQGEEIITYEHELCEYLEKTLGPTSLAPQDFDEKRSRSALRALDYKHMKHISLPYVMEDVRRIAVMIRTLMQYDSSASMKHSVHYLLMSAISNMGTSRHVPYLEMAANDDIMGCLCLTEIGHGSNAKGIRTTATYDPKREEFVLNTPDFHAAKCWAGALAQTATHAIVFAQLYTLEQNYGIHAFVVPIRNPETLLPHQGVVLGDMGYKIGLNGLDNGFAIFHNYRIPRENLLNKIGDVTPQGAYVSALVNEKKRHGATMGRFAVERMNVACACESLAAKAITIAVRYSAVRKQFGPEGCEVPIIEYQTQQFRLLPYLSAVYVMRIFSTWAMEISHKYTVEVLLGMNFIDSPPNEFAAELHAISSGGKSLVGWICRDAIQECREACGGHGYLQLAGLGQIRNDQDATLTFEGEGHVLIQQTSNWLIKFWSAIETGETINTPLKSADFLSHFNDIIQTKYKATNTDEAQLCSNILEAYQWLVCHYVRQTIEKFNWLCKQESEFWARSKSEVFYAKNMASAFIHHVFLERTLATIDNCMDPSIKKVLSKIFALYGLWNLLKYSSALYIGGFMEGDAIALVERSVLQLCADLTEDSVALVDVIGPNDFILNSVLGHSDGLVYDRLEKALLQNTGRPKWWKEVVHKRRQFNKL